MKFLNTVNAVQDEVVAYPMNLQLFSEEEDTTTDETTSTESVTSEDNSQSNEKAEQSKEENAAWKQMRVEKEQALQAKSQIEKDLTYAKKYGNLGVFSEADLKQQYGHQGINSWEDLDNYYAAQEKNVDPEMYKELQELKKFKSEFEREKQYSKQEQELANDPVKSKFFSAWKDDIKALANSFEGDLKGNLNIAYTMMCENKVAELESQKPDMESLKKQAVQEYIESLKKGQKPVEGSGSSAVVVTPKTNTWEAARSGALEYLKQNKLFN